MSSKSKIGIALALMILVVATAPAVQCLGYLSSQTHLETHGCCPQETTPANTVLPTCCIHAPAVTSHVVNVLAPGLAAGTTLASDPLPITSWVDETLVALLDTSPPDCTSVLRI